MPLNPLRMLVVAMFLPVLWLCFLPNKALAQFPRIAALSGTDEVIILDERPGIPACGCDFCEEPRTSIFGRIFSGEWYFSFGGSREWWGNTNIRVSQPSQGNNFTVYNVRGTDDPSWVDLTSGQYNLRLGRFVDEARTLAVELNFDHTKYGTVIGQTAHITGTVAGKATDADFQLNDQFFNYALHNGANHLMVNLVKRCPLIGETNENWSVAAIGKVGVGVVLPHAENVIFGNSVDVGPKTLANAFGTNRGWWQLNGWTTGVEGGFRIVLIDPLYIEITDKVAFAQFVNVPVFQGTARHNLWMNEVILSVGITFGGGR
jgi:hypothetical protein